MNLFFTALATRIAMIHTKTARTTALTVGYGPEQRTYRGGSNVFESR